MGYCADWFVDYSASDYWRGTLLEYVIMPPINLWNLPSRDWFDNTRWVRQHSKETANQAVKERVNKKQPSDFIKGR